MSVKEEKDLPGKMSKYIILGDSKSFSKVASKRDTVLETF